MTLSEQAKWWGAGLAGLAVVLYLLSSVLMPFLAGAAIAYFADPAADRLERRGLSRTLATVIITMIAALAFAVALAVLIPLVVGQIRNAIDAAPGVIGAAQAFIESRVLPALSIEHAEGNLLSEALTQFQDQARALSFKALEGAWTISVAGFEFVALVVITPVVAFYLLLDWDRLVARVDDLLPREHAETIRGLARQVDDVLAGFVRGQLSVCLVLGAFYAAGLIVVGLPFGLLVGLFAGLISFIPFVGSIVGGLLSVGIAAFHFWSDPVWIAVVAAIFAAGQAMEGNFLTPKLVGGHVGLHPVWLMFALSAFGSLFGFAGLLVAVPTAAVIGVFLRFSVEQYKQGRLYLGAGPPE